MTNTKRQTPAGMKWVATPDLREGMVVVHELTHLVHGRVVGQPASAQVAGRSIVQLDSGSDLHGAAGDLWLVRDAAGIPRHAMTEDAAKALAKAKSLEFGQRVHVWRRGDRFYLRDRRATEADRGFTQRGFGEDGVWQAAPVTWR